MSNQSHQTAAGHHGHGDAWWQAGRVEATLIDRIDPRARLLATATFAGAVVALSSPIALIAAIGLALLAAIVGRLPPGRTVKRMIALDGFMVLVVAMLPFTQPGPAIATVFGLPVSQTGVSLGLEILLTANGVVLMLLALVGTIEPATLGHALGHLKLPDKLVHLFLFVIRYVGVLQREYGRLKEAMTARAFPGKGGLLHTWQSTGYLFGMVLVRSLDRAERVVEAMKCRGFNGHFHSFSDLAFTRRDGVFALLAAASILGLWMLETLP